MTIYTHKNGTVRVEDSEADLYASIDLVCDKVRGGTSRGPSHTALSADGGTRHRTWHCRLLGCCMSC